LLEQRSETERRLAASTRRGLDGGLLCMTAETVCAGLLGRLLYIRGWKRCMRFNHWMISSSTSQVLVDGWKNIRRPAVTTKKHKQMYRL